ncbi:CotH kinase family protein [Bythopirellula polymerisocia]|uniref:Inner spore coat protein H n=1 Tax=Bythopirellula polymerisocia TaxID=2528003 RepID=A0A5C6CGA5_9BACT|nr:CotH kinase family protein [Bythopirellula polymerisocia]TWU22757.1 Inner spore coat protein H [Bythopirellula polymerisocia]
MLLSNNSQKTVRRGRSLAFEPLEARIALDASMLRITEFMASNDGTLDDYDGDSSDWLEIYNAGIDEVDLSGMYLTDKATNLTKWAFPSGETIAGGGYRVVFASNKDTIKPNGELHTNFAMSAGGEYLGLIDVDGTTVIDEFSPEFPAQFTDVSYGVAEIASTTTTLVDSSTEVQTFVPSNGLLGTSWTAVDFLPDAGWTSGSTMGVGYDTNPDYLPLIDTNIGAQMFSENSSAYIRAQFTHSMGNSGKLMLRIKYDDGFVAYLNGQPIISRNAPENPAWNSPALSDRLDSVAVDDEVIDLSAFTSLLVEGSNVLAIHGMNIVNTSSDFLIDATLELTQITFGPDRYFVEPSPGVSNYAASLNTAPFLSELTHGGGIPTDNQDIVVTTKALPQGAAIAEVMLHYRIMFGSEESTAMFDDGLHGDGSADDGVYGASIPHTLSDPGEMVRYYVTAMDTLGESSRFPFFLSSDSTEYAGTVIADPAVTSQLAVYQWFVENPNWFRNGDGTNNYNESAAALFLNGDLYDNVIVNTKGRTSGQHVTPKFEFTAASDKEFVYSTEEESVKKFDLASIYQDPSASRLTLGFEVFREAGSNAPLAFPVHTRLNGQFHRLSIFVERINKPFLERTGLDREGAVYKADGVYAANNTSLLPGADIGTSAGMEKTNRDDIDPSFGDLQDLIAGVSTSNPNRQQYLLDNVDLPELFNTLAIYTITKHYDSATHNYYVYRDSDGDGLWRLIPWDIDLIWDRLYEPVFGRYFSGHPFIGSSSEPSWGSQYWNKLIDAVVDSPLTQELYLRRLRTLMDQILQAPGTPLANRVLENRVDTLVSTLTTEANATIANWGTITDAFSWGNLTSLNQGVNHLKDKFNDRRNYLYSLPIIPSAQPEVSNLTIGDFDADPVSGNQGEEYIEIVNPNNFAVDISGWSLTNAVEHTFVPGSVIPSQGSLYVVRDLIDFRARTTGPSSGQGLVIQGNYKGGLSTTGEVLELRNDSGVLIDTKNIPAYSGDYDGDGDVDGRDFLVWQRSFGTSAVPPGIEADGNHDGNVDGLDFELWSETYGTVAPLTASEPLISLASGSEQQNSQGLFLSKNVWLDLQLQTISLGSSIGKNEPLEDVFEAWEAAPQIAATNSLPMVVRSSQRETLLRESEEPSDDYSLDFDAAFSEFGV